MELPEVEILELLSCPIYSGNRVALSLKGLLEVHLSKGNKYFILTDQNTHEYCLPVIMESLPGEFREYIVAPGEQSKSLENAEKLWRWLLDQNASRQDLLINLGGGMVTDLGSFVASTYKRGMPYVNLPTSLIGQVDAAIGGKTSVNLSSVKNQIGTFYSPTAVYVDPVFLRTLPGDHIRSGYAEILKSALLTGEARWRQAKSKNWQEIQDWLPILRESIKMKALVVARDPEDVGIRNILNFGHTLGHALEAYSHQKYPPGMLHGDAVAAGMIGEVFLSWHKGHICWNEMVEINTFLKRAFPRLPFSGDDREEILEIVTKDKKNRSGTIRIATLKKIGEPLWDLECEQENVEKAIDHILKDIHD